MKYFWDGETPFRVVRIVPALKPGNCRCCHKMWDEGDLIAIIDFEPYAEEHWSMLHPICAKESEWNIENIKAHAAAAAATANGEKDTKGKQYEHRGTQRELINFGHAAGGPVIWEWFPKAPRDKRYGFSLHTQ